MIATPTTGRTADAPAALARTRARESDMPCGGGDGPRERPVRHARGHRLPGAQERDGALPAVLVRVRPLLQPRDRALLPDREQRADRAVPDPRGPARVAGALGGATAEPDVAGGGAVSEAASLTAIVNGTILLSVPGIPVPQGSKNPWGAEANPNTRPWRAAVAAVGTEAMRGRELLSGPVEISAFFCF